MAPTKEPLHKVPFWRIYSIQTLSEKLICGLKIVILLKSWAHLKPETCTILHIFHDLMEFQKSNHKK